MRVCIYRFVRGLPCTTRWRTWDSACRRWTWELLLRSGMCSGAECSTKYMYVRVCVCVCVCVWIHVLVYVMSSAYVRNVLNRSLFKKIICCRTLSNRYFLHIWLICHVFLCICTCRYKCRIWILPVPYCLTHLPCLRLHEGTVSRGIYTDWHITWEYIRIHLSIEIYHSLMYELRSHKRHCVNRSIHRLIYN